MPVDSSSPIRQLATAPLPWLAEVAEPGGIAVSSRVRLARNLASTPFPSRASERELQAVAEQICTAAQACPSMDDPVRYDLAKLSPVEREVLLERRLVSADLDANPAGRVVLVAGQETVSMMVNEEDHLRLQVLLPGLRPSDALKQATQLDLELLQQLTPAYRDDFGFLTSCPTNLGTGLRASVMLHVPGLVLTNRIEPIARALTRLGFAVRGAFGEGEETVAHFIQVSNQSTLGETEDEIVADLEHYVRSVIWAEENARKHLVRAQRELLYDHVGRAYAIVRFAHYLNTKEALDCISALRLGVELQLFKSLTHETINSLCRELQPGHLQMEFGLKTDSGERDRLRASRARAAVC